jgi:exosortase E/protease (VPEID-CTERM system)
VLLSESAAQQSKASTPDTGRRALFSRLAILVAVLALEWLPLSSIPTGHGGGMTGRALVAFLVFFFFFGYFRLRSQLNDLCRNLPGAAPEWKFLWAHAGSMLIFLMVSRIPRATGGPLRIADSFSWYGSGLGAIVFGGCVLIPPALWSTLVRRTGRLWIFAALSAAAAWIVVTPLWATWETATWAPGIHLTFALTAKLLRPFAPDLISDSTKMVIGTPRFLVRIRGACAGLEGAGLMLVFSTAWLWLSRAERRFPYALVLIPVSIGIMWLSNSVRIAALILIGNAGAPGIAMGGFHSQAGWISFNLVALLVIVFAGKISWWNAPNPRTHIKEVGDNPTAAYLTPFLIIVAASLISRAMTADFEWLYPIRLFAGGAALWFFRPQYRGLGWRCDWLAPVAGVAVFAIWMVFDGLHGAAVRGLMPAALSSAPTLVRTGWLVCRVTAAVVCVPIAEELAFRGFLIRRLLSADFDSLPLRSFTVFAVVVSSLIFGLLHGNRWVEGSLAGLLYAVVFLRRGRIGDAIVAHSVTNGLLVAAVLLGGRWEVW